MRGHLEDLDHEELWALFLTSANTLIEAEMLTKEALSATLYSNTVVKRAIRGSEATRGVYRPEKQKNPLQDIL